MSKLDMSKCEYYDDSTVFDMDFNEIPNEYCLLFDNECKKVRKTSKCVYRLKTQLKIAKYFIKCIAEKRLGNIPYYKQAEITLSMIEGKK